MDLFSLKSWSVDWILLRAEDLAIWNHCSWITIEVPVCHYRNDGGKPHTPSAALGGS
jgi:hypothetical protein